MDEHGKPDMPKPHGRIEEAEPDRRVEELYRQWKFRRNITIALSIAYLPIFFAVVGGFLSMGGVIDDVIIVVPNMAIWIAYASMQYTAYHIDVWTEDE